MKSQLIEVQSLRRHDGTKRIQVRCLDGYTKLCKHIYPMDRDEFESGRYFRCEPCQEARNKEKADMSMWSRFTARRN